MQLELKHITPYLLYGLECIYSGYGKESEEIANITAVINDKSGWEVRVQTESGIIDEDVLFYCKPILRHLSDLTKEIEHNGERFVPIEVLNIPYGLVSSLNSQNILRMPYEAINKLFEWHFDVFGLGEHGLCLYTDEEKNII